MARIKLTLDDSTRDNLGVAFVESTLRGYVVTYSRENWTTIGRPKGESFDTLRDALFEAAMYLVDKND